MIQGEPNYDLNIDFWIEVTKKIKQTYTFQNKLRVYQILHNFLMPRGVNHILNAEYIDFIGNRQSGGHTTKDFNRWRARAITILLQVNGLTLRPEFNLTSHINNVLDSQYLSYEKEMMVRKAQGMMAVDDSVVSNYINVSVVYSTEQIFTKQVVRCSETVHISNEDEAVMEDIQEVDKLDQNNQSVHNQANPFQWQEMKNVDQPHTIEVRNAFHQENRFSFSDQFRQTYPLKSLSL